MRQVNVNGVNLEYTEQGRGAPVVLVHGSVSDYRTWSVVQPRFAERYRTIAFSRRYHWPNERIPSDHRVYTP